jgi:hypothetical protein
MVSSVHVVHHHSNRSFLLSIDVEIARWQRLYAVLWQHCAAFRSISMVEAVHPTETRPTRDAATVVRQPWLGSVALAIGPLVIMLSLRQLQ